MRHTWHVHKAEAMHKKQTEQLWKARHPSPSRFPQTAEQPSDLTRMGIFLFFFFFGFRYRYSEMFSHARKFHGQRHLQSWWPWPTVLSPPLLVCLDFARTQAQGLLGLLFQQLWVLPSSISVLASLQREFLSELSQDIDCGDAQGSTSCILSPC
jgi:hypothetical protein